MATSRKEYEMLFKLKAALGNNFNTSFSGALKVTKTLQNEMAKINKLSGKIDSFKKNTDAVEKNKEKLAALTTEHEKLQKEMSQTENPSESLRKKFEKNQTQIENVTTRIAQQKEKLSALGTELKYAGVNTNNLEKANSDLSKSYEEVKKTQQEYTKLLNAQEENRAAISKTKGDLLKTVGAIGAVGAAIYAGPVKSAIEFESAFAGVKKTVEATPEELMKLEKEIRQLSKTLPASTTEIASIAEAAGQLGIETENIMKFSKTMIDLGESTNLSAADAADSLARFANITGMSQGDFDKLGSVIVELGNNFATTESEIVEMSMRLAGAGSQVGLSESQIMGFATALSSVGIEAEMGGSAFSKTMVNMKVASEVGTGKAVQAIEKTGMSLRELQLLASNNSMDFKALSDSLGYTSQELKGFVDNRQKLEDFARVTGITADEFANLFNDNTSDAIAGFIAGLSKMDEDGISAIATLDEMGFKEVRLRDTLLRATNAQELFSEAQTMGNEAWTKNNALVKEASQRYATTESLIKTMKNNFNDAGISIGNVFLPHVAEASKRIAETAGQFSAFAAKNPELIKTITKLAGSLLMVKAGSQAAKLGFLQLKSIGTTLKIVKLFNSDISKLGVEGVKNLSNLSKTVGILKASFTLLCGPIGIAVGAVAAITASVYLFKKAQEKTRQETLHFSKDLKTAANNFEEINNKAKGTQELIDEYRELARKIRDTATSSDEAATAKERMLEIEELLVEKNPDVLSKYDLENGKIVENINFLEQKIGKELEIARIQYEQAQYEAGKNLPNTLQEIAALNEKTASLQQQYDTSKKVRDELMGISQDWQIFSLGEHGEVETAAKIEELTEKANKLGESIGGDWNIKGIEDIFNTYKDFESGTSKLVDDIAATNEELSTATQSVKDYYDSSLKLIELDLGGTLEGTTQKLAAMKSEYDELVKKGEGGTEHAIELKSKIDNLELTLLSATTKVRDLGLEVAKVPDIKTINVSDAIKDIEELQAKLDQIPPTKKIMVNVVKNDGKIPGYATGGIITRPTLATFAEKSPEAAIPIDGSANSKALWLKTGKLLGMTVSPTMNRPEANSNQINIPEAKMFAKGSDYTQDVVSVRNPETVNPPTVSVAASRSGGITLKVENNPVIHVDGNVPNDLEEKLKTAYKHFENRIMEKLRQQQENEGRMEFA